MYFQTKKIGSFRNYLYEIVTKTLVTSPILSKHDYCNTLLARLPKDLINRLQKVQNTAERGITRSRKRDHISPLLYRLYWLPVQKCIIYNVCVICYKCFNQMTATYLSESLKLHVSARQLRSSADQTTLGVPLRNSKSSDYGSLLLFRP